MSHTAISPVRRLALACLLAALNLAAPCAERLNIDTWPGLAGQPQARRELIAEYIRIPSVSHPPGTPAQLNQANFIRVRNRNADPRHADAILIQAIPNGGSAFTESAAQLVEMAALRGQNFEVWGIERREKTLEDLAGMRQGILRRDAVAALRYYHGSDFLDAHGKFAGTLGGRGAKFVPLQQADIPFLADWDAEVFNRDVESVLNLIPFAQRKTNVFLYSASPGGAFLAQFAGFKLLDGNRGFQELAGIIAIEGQLTGSRIGVGEPAQADIDRYIAQVQEVRKGTLPRFQDLARLDLLGSGPNVAIPATICVLAAQFAPEQESIFPLPAAAVGGTAADNFNAALRLTNLARAAYSFSDDPLPGSFTTTVFLAHFGAGIGRLAFAPRPDVPPCAEPGPLGMQPPCVPSPGQIDPSKVYGWVDGGPAGPAVETHPLQGWTITDGAFSATWTGRDRNPTRLLTVVQTFARPATRTNAVPLTIDFPTGRRTIDSGFNLGWTWYESNRYAGIDVPFLNRFRKVHIDRPDLGVHLDVDKTAIDIPIIEYTVHSGTTNPWPALSKDFTVIDPHGLTQTPLAARKNPMNPAMNLRLYKNLDIHTADNSAGAQALAGAALPGDVGANPISDTLPDWVIARMGKAGVDLPAFTTHPTAEAR
jgi:hypothetical protein